MTLKTMPLRSRLNILFMLITSGIVIAIIIFSLVYFYFVVQSEAASNMRGKAEIVSLIYNDKMDEIMLFTKNLAANRALQVVVDLDISNKLSELLKETVARERVYHITVYDKQAKIMSSVGLDYNPLVTDGENRPVSANELVIKSLMQQTIVANELIPLASGKQVLAISCVAPVFRDNVLIGGILVRFVLNNSTDIVKKIKEKLGVDATVFEGGKPVASTVADSIDADIFARLMSKGEDSSVYEKNVIWFGGELVQYRSLTDINKIPVGVIGIHVSAGKYMTMFASAFLVFLILTFIALGAVYFFVFRVSGSITAPLLNLLDGVKKITNGDLSHQIMLDLKDEIGKLSEAFDIMRLSLQEKISTIQEMNASLENTVKERTGTIEALMETMKKYVPNQLYEAFAHGERDSNISVHYRKKITVFFSDIVNFTATTESLESEDLSDLLNTYLNSMAQIANKWGGTIDKFVGDAVMVFFGDPVFTSDEDHALRAVRMALDMIEEMKHLRAAWLDKGIQKPLHVRIGINTGYCTIGNFGSEDRMDYTIIGGNVNMAARLETAAEPDTILISHETYSLVKNKINCEFRENLNLKGISGPVKAYKVLGENDKISSVDYVKIDHTGILLKDVLINPDKLSRDEKKSLAHQLKLAFTLTMGEAQFVHDEKSDTWKLVRKKKD